MSEPDEAVESWQGRFEIGKGGGNRCVFGTPEFGSARTAMDCDHRWPVGLACGLQDKVGIPASGET